MGCWEETCFKYRWIVKYFHLSILYYKEILKISTNLLRKGSLEPYSAIFQYNNKLQPHSNQYLYPCRDRKLVHNRCYHKYICKYSLLIENYEFSTASKAILIAL